MDRMIEYFKRHNGYARTKYLKEAGFQTKTIKEYYEKGTIEKIKPGLYKLSEEFTEITAMSDICQAIPKAVIFLGTALYYHQLITFSPPQIQIAVPESYKIPKLEYLMIDVFHLRDKVYKEGVITIKKRNSEFKIYSKEKSVCDSFKFRNQIGEDIAIEALKEYLRKNNNNTSKLIEYMKITRTRNVMSSYIKAVVNS